MQHDKRSIALVTGASGGIGLAFAHVLARNGFDLVLTARSGDTLRSIAAELTQSHGVAVRVIPCDLTDTSAPKELYHTLESAGTEIDVLINNAGFGMYGMFASSDPDAQLGMIDLNTRALTELTRLFLPGMIERRNGRIVNVASTAAFQPGPLMAVYYATKAYVLSLSEALADEVQGTGVSVTALCPGPTQSGFHKAANIEHSPLVWGRHLPSSEEVAEYGYRSMMQGKTVAVHGLMNRLASVAVRLVPRRLATGIVRRIQEKRR